MKVSLKPPSHLSNYEVLQHLVAQKAENDKLKKLLQTHKTRNILASRAAYPVKDPDDKFVLPPAPPSPTPEDLRQEDEVFRRGWSEQIGFIQDEVIKYLCAEHSSTPRQHEEGIENLVQDLQEYDLAKGELLQIINLCPNEPVEIYPIIEQPDERFPDPNETLQNLASHIQTSLLDHVPNQFRPYVKEEYEGTGETGEEENQNAPGYVTGGEYAAEEEQYVNEADWGKDKEEGIGEERENDME